MECTAWFTHKYLMHGPLWFIHKSHHKPKQAILELNDIFGIFWAIVSVYLLFQNHLYFKLIGIGIIVYGILYFFLHDILVHKRIKIFGIPEKGYLRRIVKAHHIHHKTFQKTGSEAFGFIFAPKKYDQKVKTQI
jgi:beta-carotene 3-hydroxylase